MEVTSPPGQQTPIVVSGDPFEMGLSQGTQLREVIRQAHRLVDRLEAFRLMKPAWMPYVLFRKMSERRIAGILGAIFERDFIEARRRLEGISQGAGVPIESLYLFAAMESMLSEKGNVTTSPALGGCSAVAARRRRSALGEPVLVRNFDYLPVVQPLYTIRRSQPATGYSSLDFTMAPFAGTVDGVNEKGLCITYNYAYTRDVPVERSVPISIVIAEALQRCATTHEASAWIESRPRWGGGILMIVDAAGEMASLELSSTRSKVHVAGPDEDILFHTNTFRTATMREVQIPDDAVYTNRAPLLLRGSPLHESAVARFSRLERLLQTSEPLSLETLETIMADHGDDDRPSATTVCVHGPYWGTTASMQLFPQSRRLRVAFDAACRARHQEITIEPSAHTEYDRSLKGGTRQ